MEQKDLTCGITANVSPSKAYECIGRVTEWWTPNLEGGTKNLQDTFTVHFGEIFMTMKVVEAEAGKKIRWQVVDCDIVGPKDRKEWKDTTITWDISADDSSTRITLTHVGMVPAKECYKDTVGGWDYFMQKSLLPFMNEGKGLSEKPETARM